MLKEKKFWVGLSLINLLVVALLGFLMRLKMVFPLPLIDYKNILNAHSHFAFAGWVALALITFFIYDVLPGELSRSRKYQITLWGIQISAVGMLLSFPFLGYKGLSIVFSTFYIFVTYYFGWIFFNDIKKFILPPVVKWLSISSIAYLMLSSLGPYALAYIIISKSGDSLLYRDAIYTFLHLQYNGFFTLAVFAIFFFFIHKKGIQIPRLAEWFSILLIASVLPSLFVSLLWHNLTIFYIIAALGCLLILISVILFIPLMRMVGVKNIFQQPLAGTLLLFAFLSFILKMLLATGTIYPPLGNAVYGARPIIIGFLHLVFLAFVSFFILALLVEQGYFTRHSKLFALPFYVFAAGVFTKELLLMIQGLEILFQTNSNMFNWLLLAAAVLLCIGAYLLVASFYKVQSANKKAAESSATFELH